MSGSRSRGWFKISLSLIFLLACLVPAAWGGSDLPARDWNLRNLKRIEALKPGPLTFAVLGDNRGNFPVFNALLQQMTRDPGLEFAVHLGDMVESGDLQNYRDFFPAVRQYLPMPLLGVIGNHELSGDPTGRLYQEIFGPRYFSFQVHGHYFIIVDDADQAGPGAAQWRWLEAELQKSQACRTRLVFLHVPLFDPRGGDHHHCLPPESGRRLAALFRQYRVSHIFAAHLHSYFDGWWDGVPYSLTAGAGAQLYGRDPAHFFFHYLKVTVKGDKVQVQVQPLEPGSEPVSGYEYNFSNQPKVGN